MFCSRCGFGQPDDHRFCVRCGAGLPRDLLPQRRAKVSRWFMAMPVAPTDPDAAALRVSRYLEEVDLRSSEGSVRVPSHHVRFSIWVEDRAVCALSISDDEAEQLATFLLAAVPNGSQPLVSS